MGDVWASLPEVDLSGDVFSSRLPLGPEGQIIHGTLENGMKYYVRRCSKPKERAALALAVRVGSVVEEEGEEGVAHILEHLAFNATEHYSNHDIVRFLESIGATFGACQNAYTSADETVYTLTVPTDKAELLDQAISVLSEFAFRIRCAPEDLSKERGAVLEEWRMTQNSTGRTQQAHWKLILQGSKYAERLPIGSEKVIRTVTADKVAAFYRRWYTPDRMALLAVGDFPDEAAVIASIKQHMSPASHQPPPKRALAPWPPPEPNPADASPPPSPRDPTPSPTDPLTDPVTDPVTGHGIGWAPHEQPRCCAFVDREAGNSLVYASFKLGRRRMTSPEHYLDSIKDTVFMTVLSNRLYRLSRLPQPPFFSAHVDVESICAEVDTCAVTVSAQAGSTLKALEVVLTELARLRLHGITDAELERALADEAAEAESMYTERDQGHCTSIRDEYVRHFLSGELVTGQEYEARLIKALLPRVTKEGVEARAAAWAPSCSAVYKTVEHKRCHKDEAVRAVVQKVAAAEAAGDIPPPSACELPDGLMAGGPAGGALTVQDALVSERRLELLGATEFMLCNGVRVYLKETGFADDEVLINGVALGGLSELPPAAHPTGAMAGMIAEQLGCWGHPSEVLTELLAGKRLDLASSESAYSRSISGNCSPVDLEAALQLLHMFFTTKLTVVEEELAGVMSMVSHSVDAQLRMPVAKYHERLRSINYGGCYFFEPLTRDKLAKVDPHLAIAHHTAAHSDPAEWTFVFTGKITRNKLLPLLATYLASIPVPPEQVQDPLALPQAATQQQRLPPSLPAQQQQQPSQTPPQQQQLLPPEPEAGAAADTAAAAGLVGPDPGGEPSRTPAPPLTPEPSSPRAPALEDEATPGLPPSEPHRPSTLEQMMPPTQPPAQQDADQEAQQPAPQEAGQDAEQQEPAASAAAAAPPPAPPNRRRDPRTLTALPWSFPSEPLVEDVHVAMVSPITQCQVTFPVKLPRSRARECLQQVEMCCRLLETRLLQRLRFQFGDVYTVVVSPFFGCTAPSCQGDLEGDVEIIFTCDPANRVRLVEMALDTMQQLQDEGPTLQEVDSLRTQERLEWDSLQEENSYWQDMAVTVYQSRTYAEVGDADETYRRVRDARLKAVSELSPVSLRAAYVSLFPHPCRSRYTAIAMVPRSITQMVLTTLGLGRFCTGAGGCSSGSSSTYWTAAAGALLLATSVGALIAWRSSRRTGGGGAVGGLAAPPVLRGG